MIEWSIIAWHVTTHYVAFLRGATLESQRACTCCTLLWQLRKKFAPAGFAISLCPRATLPEPFLPGCESHAPNYLEGQAAVPRSLEL